MQLFISLKFYTIRKNQALLFTWPPFRAIVFLFLGLLVFSPSDQLRAQESSGDKSEQQLALDSIDVLLTSFSKDTILPGFAVAIFDEDSIFYSKGFGFANVETRQRFRSSSVQMIASVSKTFLAVSLMQCVDKGLLSLDDDINEILPFDVINPHFPDQNITIRHLATHTSGINDDLIKGKNYLFSEPLDKSKFQSAWASIIDTYNKNQPMVMADFLEASLSKEGMWYDENSFLKIKAGTHYEYSNIAMGLLAMIMEITTGVDYRKYTEVNILEPIGMKSSTWDLDKVDTERHVTYYNEDYNTVPNYYCITYPDGGLYASVSDLTAYLQEIMKTLSGKSNLLSRESAEEMVSIQSKLLETPTAVLWDIEHPCCIGHGGNDFGVATLMFFQPDTGIGRILFTNISIEYEQQEERFYAIFNELFRFKK